MVQRIMYAIYPESEYTVQKFMDRLEIAGIYTNRIKSSDKYDYFESSWDDKEIPLLSVQKGNCRNAGAKMKQLEYKGKPVACGSVYFLKKQKNLSNAQIGELFQVSESTISRRIKKHSVDGNFNENSKTIF